jgi:hypothetical protein
MSGAIHSLPQYAFMAWCLVKAQGQLYLYIYLKVIRYEGVDLVELAHDMIQWRAVVNTSCDIRVICTFSRDMN